MNNNILQSRPIGTAIFQNQQINIGAFASCGGSPTVAAMLEQSANAKSSSKSVAKRLKEGRRVGGGGHFSAALRAKRRTHFGQYAGGYLSQPAPAAVARRNERERNRVKLVNAGFANLRNQLPDGEKNKKMSKVETLRSAVDYIKQLQEILDEDGSVGVDFTPSGIESSTSVSSSPARSPIGSASSEPLSPEEAEWANFSTWFLGDEMD